ncbi:MAG: tyrosine-type recombinase/integrase [Clostridiales bacterium]|nr:tyrosine-type recombinase/integrase [Candidatus Blautia equi]
MPKEPTYRDMKNDQYESRIESLLTELPPFCSEFMFAISAAKPGSTRYGYLIDIKLFLEFMTQKLPAYKKYAVADIPFEALSKITPVDMDMYMNYLNSYESDGRRYHNKDAGKLRKIASLSTMYKFFLRRGKISVNPTIFVERPTIKKAEKIVLTDDEVDNLLTDIESGKNLTEAQLRTHDKKKYRDLAIVILMLATGIRVSELVGLNLTDVYFDTPEVDDQGNIVYRARVIRKRGKVENVDFNEGCMMAIKRYLEEERPALLSCGSNDEEPALFLSLKGGRLATNSVEHMVNTYSRGSIPLKNITPHKFRKTRGTNLYRETGDIQLVADVLGHDSVEVTSKHYILTDEDRKKNTANIKAPV